MELSEAELDRILAPPLILTVLLVILVLLLPFVGVFNALFVDLLDLGQNAWSGALGVQIYLVLLVTVGLARLGVTVIRTERMIRSGAKPESE